MADNKPATGGKPVVPGAKATDKKPAAPKDKTASFKTIAARRANNVVKQLELLGNTANRGNYEYTDEQVEKVFEAISEAYDICKAKFATKAAKDKKVITL